MRFESVPALTPPLVRRYVSGDPALREIYARMPFDPARAPVSPEASRAIDEETLARTAALNRGAGCGPETNASLEKLRDRASVAVLAGQQPGLMLGPLFALYKIVTLIARCRTWEDASGVPFVPVFWIASHDADLPEIDHVHVPGPGGDPEKIRFGWNEIARRQLGGYEIDESSWSAFTGTLRDRLPGTEFREDALERFTPASFPASATSAFTAAVHALFPGSGIVCFDGTDAERCAPGRAFLARVLREPDRTIEAWRRGEEAVRGAGLETTLDLPDGRFPLFLVRDGIRIPLSRDGARFVTDDGESFEPSAIADDVIAGALTVTPNAGIRPLLQDCLFGTGATIAGQSELAYHPQLGPLYETFDIPRPLLVPRASATLVHFRAADRLAELDLSLEDLRMSAGEENAPAALDVHDESRSRFLDAVEQAWTRFAGDVQSESGASALPGAGDTGAQLLKSAAKSADRLVKQADRAGENRARHIHKLTQDLAPKGTAQEFVWSVLPFLTRYGADFAGRLAAALPIDTCEHQSVVIDPRGAS